MMNRSFSRTSPLSLTIYFILAALEGIGVIFALLALPRDPGRAALLGLSLGRLLLIALALLTALVSLGLAILAWRNPALVSNLLDKLLVHPSRNLALGALLFLALLSTGFTFLPLASFAPDEAIALRLRPFLAWLTLLSIQTLLLGLYSLRTHPSLESRKPNRLALIFAAILALTLLHWFVLARHAPVFPDDWYWHYTHKPPVSLGLVLLLVLLAVAVLWLVFRTRMHILYKLLLLVVLGYSLQFGFALLEGRGLDGLRDRMVTVLHAEFVTIAVKQGSMLATVRNYEALVDAGVMGNYAPSKPPGQLLLYMATDRLAALSKPTELAVFRAENLRTFATYTWPLLAALTVVPLFCLARLLLDEQRALLAAVLYLFVSSVILIPLQPDQAFYSGFFVLALLLAGLAFKKKSLWLAFLAGIWVYLILFATFALAAVFPFIGALGFLFLRDEGGFDWRTALRLGLAFLAGLVLTDLVFRFALNYDILLRYQKALAFHAANKGVDWTLGNTFYFAGLNALEFALWIGIPVVFLAVLGLTRAIRSAQSRQWNASTLLSITLFATLLFVDLFGETALEVARLWLFFVPAVVLLAADEITVHRESAHRWLIPLIFLLQAGTIYFTKVYMDFY